MLLIQTSHNPFNVCWYLRTNHSYKKKNYKTFSQRFTKVFILERAQTAIAKPTIIHFNKHKDEHGKESKLAFYTLRWVIDVRKCAPLTIFIIVQQGSGRAPPLFSILVSDLLLFLIWRNECAYGLINHLRIQSGMG